MPLTLSFDFLALAPVLVLALIAAWGDLQPMLPYLLGRTAYGGARHGRIPRRLQLFWLILALLLLPGAYLWEAGGLTFWARTWVEASEGLPYWGAVLLNAGIAFVIGVVLWEMRLWAAGDAKIFALLALSVPLSFYKNNYFSYFPSFVLLFNTFVALFALLLLEFVTRTGRYLIQTRGQALVNGIRSSIGSVKSNKMKYVNIIIMFLAIFTMIRILRHFAQGGIQEYLHLNKTVIFVILAIVFHPISRFAQKKGSTIASALVVASYLVYGIFFDPTGEALLELVNIGWLSISLILFRALYDAYLKATDTEAIPSNEVRKGMLLTPEEEQGFRERSQFFELRIRSFSPDGLTEDQAASIREWCEANGKPTLKVARTIPFAPALFLGIVLTVAVQGLVLIL